MRKTSLALVLLLSLLISSVAFAQEAQQSNDQSQPSDVIPPPNSEDPAKLGFQQFYKCHGDAKGLGDTETANACLTECTNQPDAKGCWWLDGTGGFDRECRICLDGPPSRDIFSNDWGIAITQ